MKLSCIGSNAIQQVCSAGKKTFLLHRNGRTRTPPPEPPFSTGCFDETSIKMFFLRDRYSGQMDILHDGPHNSQTTGFCRKSINLVRAPSDVTEKAFNGIGGTNIPMHHLRTRSTHRAVRMMVESVWEPWRTVK